MGTNRTENVQKKTNEANLIKCLRTVVILFLIFSITFCLNNSLYDSLSLGAVYIHMRKLLKLIKAIIQHNTALQKKIAWQKAA